MGESTVLSLLSEFKSGNRKVADFVEETIENSAKQSDLNSIISINPKTTQVEKPNPSPDTVVKKIIDQAGCKSLT